jgi:hypothetical protein
MTEVELEAMIARAAERGAEQALKRIGLQDESSYDDVRELRGLLNAWRETKKTVGQTVARWVTTAILVTLAAGIYMKVK